MKKPMHVDASASLTSRSTRWAKGAGGALVTLVLGGQILGCALTTKSDPIDTRYFEPEPPHPAQVASSQVESASRPLELQLGRVTASAYLKSRIVFRTSSVELGAYEDRQWTERPEDYLRRSVSTALFGDGRGIAHVLSGDAPTLDVELTGFEEIRKGSKTSGRVAIRYALRDDHSVWQTDSIAVELPTADGSRKPEKVVAAISAALTKVTTTLADKVAARLKAGAVNPSSTASN